MKALHLDFIRAPAPPRWPQLVLLVVAGAFAADVARNYVETRDSIDVIERQLVRKSRTSLPADVPRTRSIQYREGDLAAARETIRRMSLPWDRLFAAIESARTEGTLLLAVEPEADAGSVTLTGEARDYLRLLNYVSALSTADGLQRVQLVRHAAISGHPQRALAFTITASWGNPR